MVEDKPLRVVIVSEDANFHEFARSIVGPGAAVQTIGEAGRDADLYLVDARGMGPELIAELKRTSPTAAILLMPVNTRAAHFLRCRLPGQQLARMTYREALEVAGADTIRDYLRALLTRHEGNVTKAALAARLERESLHRLMRRHGLMASAFRKPRS